MTTGSLVFELLKPNLEDLFPTLWEPVLTKDDFVADQLLSDVSSSNFSV